MHRIRLRGPWEFAQLSPDGNLSSWLAQGGHSHGRITLPINNDQLSELPQSSRLVISRTFNQPTGLEELTSLRLILAPANLASTVWLNAAPLLSDEGNSTFEILTSIKPNNRVHLELAHPCLLTQVEVWLELRAEH